MDYKEYKQMVIESEKGSLTDYPKILHAIMGMNGEAGECVDILKKTIFQGHDFSEEHLLNELGDVCWYTMLFMVESDINIDHVFEYIDRLVHVKQWKDKPTYLGLNYVMDLNSDCGKVIDIYYNCIGNPSLTALGTLRSIFYNIKKAANVFDKTLEDIFDINYRKIQQRYPEGFSIDKSINRLPEGAFPIRDRNGEIEGYIYPDHSKPKCTVEQYDNRWIKKPGEKTYE